MKSSQTARLLLAGVLGQALLAPQNAPQPVTSPVSNLINAHLPAWLRISGEERARMESITGEGFQDVSDLYLLNRLRLNMDVRPLRWLSFSFQAEDSRVFGQNIQPAPASQKNAMDLRLGWLQVGGNESAAALRVGRQRLDFGDGRLVSDPNWSNVGRSFDAARLTLRYRLLKLDLFSGAAVKVNPVHFDEPTPGEHFHGAYGSIAGVIPGGVVEPYLFWRLEHGYKSEMGTPGKLDQKTLGLRWSGKLRYGLDYTWEMAFQTGSWAGDRIGAWMGHWVVGHTLADTRHQPRIFVEYNRASGDPVAKDARHGTFDGLFASAHDKYGLTDLICSSNVIHLRPGFQYTIEPKLTAGLAYDGFWLASARDALYIGGRAVSRSDAGAAGTHVGQEADAQLQWSVSGATQLTAGYGRLFPGGLLRQTTAGVPYNIIFWNVVQRF